MRTQKRLIVACAAVSMALFASTAAFAAESGTGETAAYGYLAGQQKNEERHGQFAELQGLTTDEEREAFFKDHGIGGDGPHSDASHLDAEALVVAGVIDQDTADRIAEWAGAKHEALSGSYAGWASMTPEDRQAFYSQRQADSQKGDAVSELLEEGIITKEQADAIDAYLSAHE